MNLHRKALKLVAEKLGNDKIIVIYGARQVGKTTLVKQILKQTSDSCMLVSGEELAYQNAFSQASLLSMLDVIGDNKILFIDEAQAIDNIGLNIKILHDAKPKLKIILTGSSSFDLANNIVEPLTGRTSTTILYPISIEELYEHYTPFELKQKRDELLKYGMYPEVLTLPTSKQKTAHLLELSNAYLYKDVLQLTQIKHAKILHKLLQLLAYQIGQLVSVQELANSLQLSFDTVNSYLDLLEKAFVIKQISGFSNNPRKEISKMGKILFLDTGIRNAVIQNFSDTSIRPDIGGLWENFLFMERCKYNAYNKNYSHQSFWRKYSGAEVDYIEQHDGQVNAYEFKWGEKTKSKSGVSWKNDYPNYDYTLINNSNWLDFVCGKI